MEWIFQENKKIDFILKVILKIKHMSGKPFVTTIENINQGNIKFGKIESADSIPNAKGSRAAVGVEGMPDNHLTCIPRNGKWRDNNTCLHIVFKDKMFSIGLHPQYKFAGKGAPPVPKVPENVVGFSLMVPLVNKDNYPNKLTERERQVLAGFKALHKAAQKFIMANKKSLPIAFRGLEDDKLMKCVQPIESPAKDAYAPTLFAKVGYYSAKNEEVKNGKKTEAKPERFTTIFKGPGGKIDPKTIVGVSGHCSFVLKVNHLLFITGDSEKDMKIKFDTELTEVNFTKSIRQESNLLGDNTDVEEVEPTSTLEAFSIDPTKSYGDAASNYIADSGSDDDVPQPKVSKKSKQVESDDEEPVKPKKSVETKVKHQVESDDDEPAPKVSKKHQLVEDDEPAPVKSKKHQPVDEDEDEPKPKKKSK